MAELGAACIRFALLIAIAGLGAAVHAGLSRRADWTRVAERGVLVVAVFVAIAIAALFTGFATGDFRMSYVAAHSARSMAMPYRLAALWGGQAGSLLLWLFMLCAYSSACVFANRQ